MNLKMSGKAKDITKALDYLGTKYYGWTLENFSKSKEMKSEARLLNKYGVKIE